MSKFTLGLEVEIEGNRCRVNRVMADGTKSPDEWMSLPIPQAQLSLSHSPASHLAIAVAAYEMNAGKSDLRTLLTDKPK